MNNEYKLEEKAIKIIFSPNLNPFEKRKLLDLLSEELQESKRKQ